MADFACVNGKIVKKEDAAISINDRGFLYGYGLFETIRIYGGTPVFWKAHLDRLFESAQKIELPLNLGKEDITGMAGKVIKENELHDGSMRLTVTEDNIVITVTRGTPYGKEFYRDGFKAGFLKTRRNEESSLVYLKTLNFMENIMGRREASRQGWNEGIFLNRAEYVCEGTVSNVFLVKDDMLITPQVDSGLLPGVMREVVLDLACRAGIKTKECRVLPAEIEEASECFLTNSLMGVMPLTCLEEKNIGAGRPGPVTLDIMKRCEKYYTSL